VDGKGIPLKPFIKDLLTNGIKGMLSSLKGCKAPQSIDIHIENTGEEH
jgi:hypothetical protein